MTPGELRDALCSIFCGDLTVREVPAGLAVSAMFEGADGDRLGCLVEQHGLGWGLSDDGAFLGDLEGYGVDVRKGGRADFLARALRPAGARVDPDTLQIVADLEGEPSAGDILAFLAALSRAQDVAFWTKERVRSTFKEDATRALREVLGEAADLQGSTAVDARLAEIPADLVIRPRGSGEGGAVTAVFLVQALDALQEALLLALELRAQQRRDVRVAAMIEDNSVNMSAAKAVRAVNRIDAVAFFRNDEKEAAFKIARTAIPNLAVAA
ncbi:DUF1828 domain-containing protein [Muricoccus radiodurans]|uniref:DUF1828 domain-containing protein n=1 Tax=Muricoccus radiodurans TaxID=2231721 RepID=UPI003CF30C3D